MEPAAELDPLAAATSVTGAATTAATAVTAAAGAVSTATGAVSTAASAAAGTKLTLAGIVALIATLWGSLDVTVSTLLALMLLDLVSGVIAGAAAGAVASHVGIAGWRAKSLTLCLVAAVALGQRSLPGLPMVQLVAGGFCGLEVLSIVENARRAGVPLPAVLSRYLAANPAPAAPAAPAAPEGAAAAR